MSELTKHLKDSSHWGYLGGAFDPPHIGHIQLAKSLCVSESLDGVIIAPSFSPPHRTAALSSYSNRLAMCELAISAEENMIVSDIESQLPTPSYTFDVISELKKRFEQVRFSVLIGADNLEILSSWNRIELLLEMSQLIVGSRPQFQQNLKEDIKTRLPAKLQNRIKIVQSSLIDISSSALRKQLLEHNAELQALNKDVAQYIDQHKLYRSESTI